MLHIKKGSIKSSLATDSTAGRLVAPEIEGVRIINPEDKKSEPVSRPAERHQGSKPESAQSLHGRNSAQALQPNDSLHSLNASTRMLPNSQYDQRSVAAMRTVRQ